MSDDDTMVRITQRQVYDEVVSMQKNHRDDMEFIKDKLVKIEHHAEQTNGRVTNLEKVSVGKYARDHPFKTSQFVLYSVVVIIVLTLMAIHLGDKLFVYLGLVL